MIRIDNPLLDTVSKKAKESLRRRQNHNFHREPADPMQRLLNAMEPLSYIRPHKHENPAKREAFFSLRGRILVVEFDESGNISDHVLLDPANGSFGAEIPAGTFHTIISLDPGAVAYEVKDGPYDPANDKNFAAWAPPEGGPGTDEYLQKILLGLGIKPAGDRKQI